MPHLRIETNISKEKFTSNFLVDTTDVIAKALGKPKSYCVVSAIPDLPMAWGGTTEPAAIVTLMSIGQLGVEPNKKISKVLSEHFEKTLQLPKTRVYINFIDAASKDVGYDGTTFKEILG
ncbi:macrophage migration inhibitory factor-like [Bacillus rossius redtenbacheri]|uniref:macrophage migration inhibitory factor-like n=1 Tax=Bacillus rossius redtenbacheri TaxID=93214 RepID=UPI002FDF052B